MKRTFFLLALCMAFPQTGYSQENDRPKPTIQDLDFLIGAWDITFEFYDPRSPASVVVLRETGSVICKYDMEFNGTPKFIVCEGKMDGSNGWKRVFKEYTEYNSLKGSFERIAIYSNWPGMARDLVIFEPTTRALDVRGTLDVENHLTERYQDYYYFNEDFSEYERIAFSNFSDMAVNEYNLVLKSIGKKILTPK